MASVAPTATSTKHLRAVLRQLHTPETLLVDVGVNIGQTLIKYALLAGPNCRYIGFEPNVKAAAYVDEVIARNALSLASVVPIGLSEDKRLTHLLMTSVGSTDPAASVDPLIRDSPFTRRARWSRLPMGIRRWRTSASRRDRSSSRSMLRARRSR